MTRDAVVYASGRVGCNWNGYADRSYVIRCLTWERAQEWADYYRRYGWSASVRWAKTGAEEEVA